MKSEPGELALFSDPRVWQPDRRDQVALAQSVASTIESIRSVLQARGARPLTFWASAISTDQPSCSSVSWTIRAPVIDSIDRADRLVVGLLDPPGERFQGAGVGRDDELVEVLSLIGEQADVELSFD